MLTPSIGSCCTPCTKVGSGSPAASSTVGATSITCGTGNGVALRPDAIRRVDDRAVAGAAECDATCFVHWYGVHGCAQPTA